MNPERRRSLRRIPQSLIYLDLEPNNGGIVLDLSEQGMKISVANPLANTNAGEIRFLLSLQPKQRASGTGRIAWISSSGRSVGVKFVALPQASLGQIRKWLALQPDPASPWAAEPAAGEPADVAESPASPGDAPFAAPSLSPGETGVAEVTASLPLPEVKDGPGLPSILSLYDRDSRDNPPARSLAPEPPEESATEAARVAGIDSLCPADLAPPDEAATESMARDLRPGQLSEIPSGSPEEEQAKETTPVEEDSTAEKRATPSPPPPWLEALIKAECHRLDEGMSLEKEQEPKDAEPVRAESGETEPEGTGAEGQTEREPEPPALTDSPKALYLPNYQLNPDWMAQPLQKPKFRLRDSGETATKLALERFEEFGWTLERDWHIWVALVLVSAGFLALAQDPPLPLVAVALWAASAVIAVKRKQRRRPAGQAGTGRQ